ncbi:MAG TPA: hypothetical protein VHT52_03410 [Stellaceae bacterium]|jgi:hypothetical protein|nr:hypothetical protein [Stellaceae bacterium]
MTDLDPQSTADFWDAYVRAAGGGAMLAQAGRTFAGAAPELCSPAGSRRRIQPAA